MWTFLVNYVTQNNSYVQLLAMVCVFQPLLRDQSQLSTERFVKPAAARDFVCAYLWLPFALQYQNVGFQYIWVISVLKYISRCVNKMHIDPNDNTLLLNIFFIMVRQVMGMLKKPNLVITNTQLKHHAKKNVRWKDNPVAFAS